MDRYVFLSVIIGFILAAFIILPADADFFNNNLVRDKSDDILLYRRLLDDALPDSVEVSAPPSQPVLINPNKAIEPGITLADSIDTQNRSVKRWRDITGLRNDPYEVMSMEQYIEEGLRRNFYKKWQDNKKRQTLWSESSEDKGGGITDLDFVLPGSKALERFVGGETRINIDGREKITFSGRSEYTEGQVETSVSKNSSFPSLTMKQEPSFRINGDVGRVHIDIKQDPSSGQFSNLEENINIKYQGEDRDIIKYIEAGNTSLSLEGATFAGYRGTHKGLFGIRAEGQLGPLKFTTIASQEKSEANVKSYRGSAEEATTQIKDYEYRRNTYFFVDDYYRSEFKDQFYLDIMHVIRDDSLAVIEVYEDDGNVYNNLSEGTFAYRGEAMPMDMKSGEIQEDLKVEGYFHRMEPMVDYYVDRQLGFIQFARSVPDESTIGVYIRTRGGVEMGNLADYDTNDETSKIELKMIKKKKQLPTDTHTWPLEWKNVYYLGQRNIDPEGLELRIKMKATDGVSRDTQDGVTYIHILGLDSKSETGEDVPDNKVDLSRGFINFASGELIFPGVEPFNPEREYPDIDTELNVKVPKIYNTSNLEEMDEATKYYIEVQTANRQATINIGGMNGVSEGTEKVMLNGKQLTRGTDYRIDYMSGTVTLLNEEAMSPTADLQIMYEETTAMQETQKTLVGLRTELDILSNSRIGAVTLFKNESTRDQRVKLGQEPSRMFLFDTDAQFNFESRGVTNALDKLPGLNLRDASTFKIETEVARSMPTLNTRGTVYIDDFEGSQNQPIGVVRSKWTKSSAPDISTTSSQLLKRGRLQWYNPWNRVKSKDIWPEKETSAGENTVHVLNLGYGKPAGEHADDSFAGIMTNFYGSGEDLSRARFIEIWARGSKGDLKIDIGSISEDINGNGILDTEDEPIPGQGHGDGVLTADEDTGIDGRTDAEEKLYYRQLGDEAEDTATKNYYYELADRSDPEGDNFFYKSGDKNNYAGINGTEKNASDGDRLGFPDTEDINGNGVLDTTNSYYEYSLSFNDPNDPYLVEDSVPSGDQYGWRLFRIPLWNNERAIVGGVTAPDSTLIEFARMWVTSTDSTMIQIASLQIVESTWLEQGIEGDALGNDIVRVTNVNTHENNIYSPPPGVTAEIDRETKIRKKEQSLSVEVENLQPGNTGFIYRNFQQMNLTDYQALSMYVHGADDFPGSGAEESDVEMVLRFGADKDNYYEYRTQVFQGWDSRNHVEIDFEQCTNLKLMEGYKDAVAYPDSIAAPADTVGTKIYTIHGSPSLDNVKIVSIGIKNNKDTQLNTSIWTDELRMDSERDMAGIASRVGVTTNLAGFMNIVANASKKEDDFHDMNSKTGSGSDQTEWNGNVTMNLDRFAPQRWQLSLPVNVTKNESSALPRLMSGSDIILQEDQKKDYESTTDATKYRVSFRKGVDSSAEIIDSFEDIKTISVGKVKDTLVHWAFDKVNASYDYGESGSSNPFSGKKFNDTIQTKIGYDVDPKELEFKVKLFDWLPVLPIERWEKFADMEYTLTPSAMNFDYTMSERNSYNTNIDGVSDTTMTKTADNKFTLGFDPFKGLKYTYNRTSKDDKIIGQEVSYTESNKISYTGPEMFYIKNNYNYSASYNETDNPRYSLSSSLGSKSLKLSNSFTFASSFGLDRFIEDISGKPKPPKKKFQREKEQKWEGSKDDKKKDDKKPEKPDEKPEEAEGTPEEKPDGAPEDGPNAPPDGGANGPLNDKMAGPPNTGPNGPPDNRAPEKDREKNKRSRDKKEATDKNADDDEKQEEQKPKKKPGEGIRTKILLKVAETVTPIDFDYSVKEANTVAGIADRPDFMVRFGSGQVDRPGDDTVETRKNSLSTDTDYSAKTSLKLPLDMGLSATSNLSINEKISPAASVLTRDQTPVDMKFRWDRLETKIPYADKFMQSLNLNSSYNSKNTESEQNGILTSDKETINFSPLFQVSTKIKTIQISFSTKKIINSQNDYSSQTTSHSKKVDNGTSTSIRYNLNSKNGLPFLKGLKLNSTINLNLTFSTNNSQSKRGVGDEAMALVQSTDSWSLAPSAEYKFSQKFRGGMQVKVENRKDMTENVTKMREVSIWGEMVF